MNGPFNKLLGDVANALGSLFGAGVSRPEWSTGELIVRRPRQRDASEVFAIESSPENVSAQRWDERTLRDMIAVFEDANFGNWADGALVGVEKASGTVVGLASLSEAPVGHDGDLMIGIQVAPKHHGRGFGTELMGTMINRLRDSGRTIWVGTAHDNHSIRRIMDKLGHAPTLVGVPYTAPNGETVDSLWYEVVPRQS